MCLVTMFLTKRTLRENKIDWPILRFPEKTRKTTFITRKRDENGVNIFPYNII